MRRRAQGQGRQAEYPHGVAHLGVLQAQAVALQGAEHLFDAPTQAVQAHHLLGRFGAVHRQGGRQSPYERLDAGRRVRLANLHQAQLQAGRVALRRIGRARDLHPARTDRHLRHPALVARPARRHGDQGLGMDRPRRRLGEQRPAVHQGPVMPSPHQQLHPRRAACEVAVDIGFLVGDHHHLSGRLQPLGRQLRPLAPASALLVLGRPARARRHRPGPTRPDARAHQPQQRLILGIHRDHPMDEEPRTLAVAAGAQPPPASRLAREAHLGGILHRHHPAPRTRLARPHAQRLKHPLRGHIRRQRYGARHLTSTAASKVLQNQRAQRHDLIKQPLPTRRRPHVPSTKPITTLPQARRLNQLSSSTGITSVHPVALWGRGTTEW